MNQRNTGLSDHMIRYGAKPDYDEAAKRLLSHRIVIAHILKMSIPEFRDSNLTPEKIMDDYLSDDFSCNSRIPLDQEAPDADTRIHCSDTEDKTITEGTVCFDVVFDVRIPGIRDGKSFMTVNIEFQAKQNIEYPLMNRVEYYLSRLMSRQKNISFTGSDYQNIQKVYSLWINLGRNRGNWCAEYPRTMVLCQGNMAEDDECNCNTPSTAIVVNIDENDKNMALLQRIVDLTKS